ncbi:2-dehydropantoate 2-reductase N-terminal domain-containing protein [Streptomyces sp. NPDC051940]|uniref:ketopantoate reductase family protein n=1 Tax=Streptomyces sp. NPDC051940 TaxID=3155675 RepID=UPI0034146751
MRYVILGAGAVGSTIGGRLHDSGHEVVLAARGRQYEALRADGLRLTLADGVRSLRIPVVGGPDELEPGGDDVLLVAVKTQDAVAALDAWAPRHGATPVICAQNGVEGERLALRRFAEVYGMCVWLPSVFVEPGVVAAPCAPLTGVLHLGRYGAGPDDTAHRVAGDLEKSGFAAPVVADVMRWKYAKLLSNLGNALDALTGDVSSPQAADLLARARTEGRAALQAAGIAYTPADEERAVRGDRVRPQPVEGVPKTGGSSWQSLARATGSIESDYLNGEIALLGRTHGVPTPVNDLLQREAAAAAHAGRGPASMTAAELAGLVG